MKSILFLMHSMPVGGAERVLIDIFDNIDYSQYEVTLLVQFKEGGLLPAVNDNVKTLHISKHGRLSNYHKIKAVILKARWLRALDNYLVRKKILSITEPHYDCIISFCQGHAHKLHTYLVNKTTTNISWIHSDLSKGNWGIGLFDMDIKKQEDAYNMMNRLVFVSEGAKDAFNHMFTINPSVRQQVIYNIVDKDKIIRLSKQCNISRPEGRFIFVNVGRLIEAKQQIRLLEAASILKDINNNFQIWILGEGHLRGELENYIREKHLEDYVVLFGNQMNPYPYIKAADCFVLSSRQEGFPIVVCEALILSKPVICTNIVGPKEILENGKYGIMTEENAVAIADAMYLLMMNPDKSRELANLSAERAKRFDASQFMNELYQIV